MSDHLELELQMVVSPLQEDDSALNDWAISRAPRVNFHFCSSYLFTRQTLRCLHVYQAMGYGKISSQTLLSRTFTIEQGRQASHLAWHLHHPVPERQLWACASELHHPLYLATHCPSFIFYLPKEYGHIQAPDLRSFYEGDLTSSIPQTQQQMQMLQV